MKDFVPYEQAGALIELGFELGEDDILKGKWALSSTNPWLWAQGTIPYGSTNGPLITAMTFSQAFRWFRKFDLHHQVHALVSGSYDYTISSGLIKEEEEIPEPSFFSYESAELSALKQLIKMRKEYNAKNSRFRLLGRKTDENTSEQD